MKNKLIILSILDNLEIPLDYVFFKKYGSKPRVLFIDVLSFLLDGNTGPKTALYFNRGEQTFNRAIRKLLPEVKLSGKQSWQQFFYDKSSYRKCTVCGSIKPIENFHRSTNTTRRHWCDSCQSQRFAEYYRKNKGRVVASVADRKARLVSATPPWADLEKIKEIYNNCPKGFHVDHIIPLQGKNISGLHIETNLQYLSAKDNLSKGNKY